VKEMLPEKLSTEIVQLLEHPELFERSEDEAIEGIEEAIKGTEEAIEGTEDDAIEGIEDVVID
jgi:hypothetical protein